MSIWKKYFVKYCKMLKNEIWKEKDYYYRTIFQKCKGNFKETWRIVNELTGQKTKNPKDYSLIINNKTETDSQLAPTNEFKTYFLRELF